MKRTNNDFKQAALFSRHRSLCGLKKADELCEYNENALVGGLRRVQGFARWAHVQRGAPQRSVAES